jgi:hypothetical protein
MKNIIMTNSLIYWADYKTIAIVLLLMLMLLVLL